MLDAATSADGTAPVSEHVLLHLRRGGDPLAQHLLAREGEVLVGYAHLDLTDPVAGGSSELAVHPDARGRGIGTELVTALLERAGQESATLGQVLLEGAGQEGAGQEGAGQEGAGQEGAGQESAGQGQGGGEQGARLRLWAHGEHPGAVRLAQKMGFRQVRTLWQLRRSLLAPLGAGPSAAARAAELPAGVRLRPFVVGQDEAEFLRVNNAAFDWHPEQGGWDVEQLKLREAEPWFDPAGFLLAVEDTEDSADSTEDTGDGSGKKHERLLGFHWTKVHGAEQHGEHQHEPIGEVYVLGVDPAARGRRLGAGLTLAGLRYLRGLGLREVMLYVEADNDAAVNVYRNLGFTRWDTDVAYLH
ncbi:MAG: mycothiol synthase [Actinomycetota bacterium]|nr:mycothiol synthase [Actinomycetota bacterium]